MSASLGSATAAAVCGLWRYKSAIRLPFFAISVREKSTSSRRGCFRGGLTVPDVLTSSNSSAKSLSAEHTMLLQSITYCTVVSEKDGMLRRPSRRSRFVVGQVCHEHGTSSSRCEESGPASRCRRRSSSGSCCM